jgi:hypothetical protein
VSSTIAAAAIKTTTAMRSVKCTASVEATALDIKNGARGPVSFFVVIA